MDFQNFQDLVNEVRASRPSWFKLQCDPHATDSEIEAAQNQLGVTLPQAYRDFVREFGGGDFVFGNLFSVSSDSVWNVVLRNTAIAAPRFIAISENGCGDYYGFRVVNTGCEDRIFFLDHEEGGKLIATQYQDLFEFLAGTALSY